LKSDPKELQELLQKELETKVRKKAKHLGGENGDLEITGAFTEIDEGNFALHFMLAFLGKAHISCRAKVVHNGQQILDEDLTASATLSCFTGGRAQLKYDTKVIADQVVKKTIKAMKTLSK
jgi:polyisoprenoid-binding protein YceI